MSNLHPVFREIADSFFLAPPPDSGSRVDPHAAVIDALEAILQEAAGPGKPYDGDSYLPPHFIETAKAAIAKATIRRATLPFGGAKHGETK